MTGISNQRKLDNIALTLSVFTLRLKSKKTYQYEVHDDFSIMKKVDKKDQHLRASEKYSSNVFLFMFILQL